MATAMPLTLDTLDPFTGPAAATAPGPPVEPLDDFVPTEALIEQELEDILAKRLSPQLDAWVQQYAVVGKRDPFLWKWCRRAVELTTLPCVPAELRDELIDTKVLGVMFDVYLDDVADRGGDGRLLESLLQLVEQDRVPDLRELPAEDRRYAEQTVAVWQEIHRRAGRYPRYEPFRDLLRFDYLQLSNVMRYSWLLNENLHLLNLAEHDLYTPANMHIMICGTLDLMASSTFDVSELGKLREVIWHAQWMGRIGNLVTTWERELGEGDFTSGVYARAVSYGHLSVDELLEGQPAAVQAAIRQGGHEQYYLRRWQAHRRAILAEQSRLRSVDVRQLVEGLERLICLHLGSRGRK